MKVGTDAVLLACMLPKNQQGKILDIGSGSGLISLAIAQNSPKALITAVEIDEIAYLQSIENFQNSNWSERIQAIHSSIQDFAENSTAKFDNILCNPPFFKNNADLSGNRKTARQDVDLSFADLLKSTAAMLRANGKFYCIISADRSAEMIFTAKENGLNLQSETLVRGKKTLKPKRSILAFSKNSFEHPKQEEIVVYNEDNSYTEQYKSITKDFYLKF